ncbi:MAG: hypothetical protein FJ102_02715 [Deltaproteobacteria bacterium]|nr:hypothetical protein [Deltaproteobacteria bacterium]
MGVWPEYEIDRLAGALMRVDLYEQRYLAVGEYHSVVNHLVRSASAACLSDREDDAIQLIARASARMDEWVRAVREGRAKAQGFSDFACTRGWLAVAIAPSAVAEETARAFLIATAISPPGPAQNARMVAAAVLGEPLSVNAAAQGAELSDAGLGLPLKRFILALFAGDEPAMRKAASNWLDEKMEATMTHEWGAYNEVPIEVSGALALAERRGRPIPLDSNRVLTRFRSR